MTRIKFEPMIYLDNAATTPVDPIVTETIMESMRHDFANSGTVYKIGLDAKKKIEKAQNEIAECLDLPPSHRIIFTSGGSESNNLFIKGLCFPDKIAAGTGIEHPSISASLEWLNDQGPSARDLLGNLNQGRFDLDEIVHFKNQKIKLLCLSHVNHELGSINVPGPIWETLNKESPQTRLFLDGVQAVGKLVLNPDLWNSVSGYSISGHKINGPKGIGLLIYDSRLELKPLIHGGRQQWGLRSGTLPVPLILGFTESLKLAVRQTGVVRDTMFKLRRHLIQGLENLGRQIPELNLTFNSSLQEDQQSPAILNFSFPPVEGEPVLHHLEQEDIFVGLGSACSGHSREPSKILTRIGLSPEEARCSLRISFGKQNTIEEVDRFIAAFGRSYQRLFLIFSRKAKK